MHRAETAHRLVPAGLGPMRVALLGTPPLMSSILSDAARRIHTFTVVDPPITELSRSPPAIDALVVAVEDDTISDRAHEILKCWPEVRVVQTQTNGRSSAMYELRPRRVFLGDLAADEILAVVNDAGPYAWNRWESETG